MSFTFSVFPRAKKLEKKLDKSNDPLALVANTGSSSRQTSSYYVTHPTYVVDYDDEYQQDDVHNNSEDLLVSAMLNQAIIQGDRVNIQSRNSGNTGRNNRRAYVQEEVVEGMNAPNETGNVQRTLRTPSSGNTSTVQCYNCSGKGHYARNCPKPRVRDSKYFMEQMLLAKQDEAGVILTDEQNDFLFADASRMEEIEELSANICLMARIQPADHTSDDGPSCESAFISEVQSSSIDENNEPMYPTHTKIINSTIGDDQINSNIKFDSFKGNVNSGSVEKDTHVPDLCAVEKLARNAYQEAEKQRIFAQQVQTQNTHLTSQLEMYKERVRILENINKDNNYLNEFLEADERAKRYNKQAQSQLQDDVHNNSEDPLVSAMLLLAKAITQNFSNPTNNRLRASSNTRNQAIIQGDRVNIQSRNSGNTGRNSRRAYVQEEVVEGMNAPKETGNVQRTLRTPSSGNTSTVQCYNCSGKGHYARNCPKPRVRDSKYFMEQMLLAKQDEAGVILTDEQNDFLFADASRMEEIEELSANICLMARIQPADHTSDDGPSYESAFISEVQSSSIDENNEPMYPTHTKIINSTIGDDQINSNIKFDSFKGNVNSGSVEKDTHVPDLCAVEKLARNAYQEAEKQQIFAQQVQKQNTHLTSQLEMYKERVRILENINKDNNYLNEFLEADERAKRYNKQAQSQLVRDRDIIRDLEKQRDKLDLDVKNYKRKNEELQKTHSILKRQMSEKRIRTMILF
ncbi:retrovirus-related pol polyprotein from transposon TNT 1-94 [Tanacetum coccineum]